MSPSLQEPALTKITQPASNDWLTGWCKDSANLTSMRTTIKSPSSSGAPYRMSWGLYDNWVLVQLPLPNSGSLTLPRLVPGAFSNKLLHKNSQFLRHFLGNLAYYNDQSQAVLQCTAMVLMIIMKYALFPFFPISSDTAVNL